MRPPVCEICGDELDPADDNGGLVRFQPDDRSREFRRRVEEEGIVGHPPDSGWFCAAHVERARVAARTMSYGEGLRHVEAHARYLDVQTLDFTLPSDLPEPVRVPLRSAEGVNRVLHHRKLALSALLGAPLTTRSSSSFRLDERHDRSVSHDTVGQHDVLHRIEYTRVGEQLVVQQIEQRVTRHGVVLAVVRLGPLDHVQVWASDERLREWTAGVLSDLMVPPPNLLDPSPDLVDVDLGSGRLAASDGFEMRWVEWDLDEVDAQAMVQRLVAALPALFEALELGEVPTLETVSRRTWDPMDGSQPPNCPFTDTTTKRGGDVVLRLESVQWDEDSVHSSSVQLSIGDHLQISAFGDNGGGRRLRSLRLYRPTTAAVVHTIDQIVRRSSVTESPPRWPRP